MSKIFDSEVTRSLLAVAFVVFFGVSLYASVENIEWLHCVGIVGTYGSMISGLWWFVRWYDRQDFHRSDNNCDGHANETLHCVCEAPPDQDLEAEAEAKLAEKLLGIHDPKMTEEYRAYSPEVTNKNLQFLKEARDAVGTKPIDTTHEYKGLVVTEGMTNSTMIPDDKDPAEFRPIWPTRGDRTPKPPSNHVKMMTDFTGTLDWNMRDPSQKEETR